MLAHLAQEQSFANQYNFQIIVISFLSSPVCLHELNGTAETGSIAEQTVLFSQSGGEENSSAGLEFEHIPHLFFSSVLPSSQVLSIHAYLLFPEVLWKFIFLLSTHESGHEEMVRAGSHLTEQMASILLGLSKM